jgi:hypothetical protein
VAWWSVEGTSEGLQGELSGEPVADAAPMADAEPPPLSAVERGHYQRY